tara:strand:- start:312 stop:665 length:354 start_codon:yes stop_codon:yes gene_type:complete
VLILILLNIVLILFPTVISYFIARNYAKTAKSTNKGAYIRAVLWPSVFSWTIFAAFGHGAIIFPLPSILAAVLYFCFYGERDVYYNPHVLLSPTIPIAVYLISYFKCKKAANKELTP